jgi:uncharacterized membrane protein YoaK (UPF0700 family)
VPSILAFIAGLLLSQLAGAWLRMAGLNARNARLVAESAMLLVLALSVGALPDHVVAASVGFIAAAQITSLSRIGEATFNTGMTTGNLRGAVSAAVTTWMNQASVPDRDRFVTLWLLCLAFPAGALLGGVGARLLGDKTAFIIAGLVGCSVIVMWRTPDPLPPT